MPEPVPYPHIVDIVIKSRNLHINWKPWLNSIALVSRTFHCGFTFFRSSLPQGSPFRVEEFHLLMEKSCGTFLSLTTPNGWQTGTLPAPPDHPIQRTISVWTQRIQASEREEDSVNFSFNLREDQRNSPHTGLMWIKSFQSNLAYLWVICLRWKVCQTNSWHETLISTCLFLSPHLIHSTPTQWVTTMNRLSYTCQVVDNLGNLPFPTKWRLFSCKLFVTED